MDTFKRIISIFNTGKLPAVVAFLTLLFACNEKPLSDLAEDPSTFIYVAHTRLDDNRGIYSKIYDIDFSQYEMTLLGGDLAANSFSNTAIIQHLDSVFDYTSPRTLWSIGNHDKTSDARFLKTTLKRKFHAYEAHDVTFITLDSQDSLSSIVNEQKDFLMATLDSVQTTSLLILTHKLIFMNGHPIMDADIETVCNGRRGDCFHCHNPNNFQSEIAPRLKELQARGVQVMVVGGDLGYKKSSFEYVDPSGIVYLGNGMWHPKDWNSVLVFSKLPQKPMSYSFVAIDSLIHRQNTLMD
ncbi:MAG: hypothetical protein ACI828_001839 [Flavobacteriales bacterium]